MKKYLATVLSLFGIGSLIIQSDFFANSIRSGMKLCFYQVIPALLPMILLSNFMLRENLCPVLSKLLHPVFHRIFGVTEYGSFSVLTGFLCGFPLASKNISYLYREGCLSFQEASFLLTFCNNCSFSFVANYLGSFCLNKALSLPHLFLFIYTPPVLTGFLNHFFYTFKPLTCTASTTKINLISDTFQALMKISVFVICFTVLTEGLSTLSLPFITNFCGLMEVTSGLSLLSSRTITKSVLWCLLLCTVFGGASSMAQCFSFLEEPAFKRAYILGKLEQILILLFLLFLFY